jgi:hypothetical protein
MDKAIAWCNKVNAKEHGTTGMIPFEQLKYEQLNPLIREYIIDKINMRRVGKDCLVSYSGNQYSVPSEYAGKDVSVVALENMFAVYYGNKQIAIHRISPAKKDIVVNPKHYKKLTVKQSFDIENTLFSENEQIDSSVLFPELAVYDEVAL